MNCRILFAVASVVVTSVSCYGYGQRRQSVNDHLEAQANREFEDPRLDFQIGHFLPSQRLTDYGFNPEYSDVNENEGNNGKFEIPWEDEETGDVGDSWKTPFWRHFKTNEIHDFPHHCHHSPEFHRTHSPTFPWQDRPQALKPSIISATPTTESTTTTTMQSKVPNIDIRLGASSENDAE
ncbi:uncharacterized protein LOC109536456 isoform X2 [Dendroctonus ponderosae]|uniref:Uncharacterized protein n=1 Tax=Dendroctonus ponderosae TaxID=77166 RepID=U4UT77_DENPD|nr:uncharacterized protein LOC109536456 isoform X2 [Dendroctonus ponderosae]ERL93361.1 hypothetical protein D910_10653 [Dendroctonus ponderosae]KAH1027067.1 hypothetical protein HUJ05_000636 [Dendroctonus ponderosae]